MAYLNKQERDQLLDDIKNKTYPQIRGILNRRDKKARLAYFRNVQQVNKWMTKYVLEGLGTEVTIVEAPIQNERNQRNEFKIEEIIVAPTDENRL